MGHKSSPRRGLWKEIKRQAQLVVRLMRDSSVPIWMRSIPLIGLIYLVSPVELLPDIPLFPFGLLDDFVVIVVCLTIFMAIVPHKIVEEHLSWLDAADITIEDLRDTRRLPPPRKDQEKK